MVERVEDRVGYVVKRVQQALGAQMSRALGDQGLTNAQYAALSALEADPGLSNADLARRSFVTPQTMNQVVAQLERAGLVERRPHAVHGRILETRVTPRGEAALATAHAAVREIEARMVSGLTDAEQAHLLAALRRCAEGLGQS